MPVDELIAHEADLAKLEEQRIQNIETQATTVLTVVLALAAFAASALDIKTLHDHTGWIGVVVLLMLAAAGFAVAARWPRALLAGFWTRVNPAYGRKEERLAKAECKIRSPLPASGDPDSILESWRARREVSNDLAEHKALWLTCSLGCLLGAFLMAGVVALIIVG
jgi:hypothetical protein